MPLNIHVVDREPLWSAHAIYERIGWIPSAGQAEFLDAYFNDKAARFFSLIAAARFGKSMAGSRACLPTFFTPGGRVWIVAPQYELGEFEFRYIVEGVGAVLGGLDRAVGITSYSNSVRSGSMSIESEWGSFIRVKSANRPQSLLGEEIDVALMAEGANTPGDVFDTFVQARLAMRRGKGILPTTPSRSGFNQWVVEWWERGQDPDFPEYRSFGPYAALDNPLYPRDAFETAYRTVPWIKFREQYLGQFVLPSGRVYNEADPDVVCVSDEDIPWEWRNYPLWVGVDFGGTDPFVALLIAQLPDGIWYVADEHYIEPGNELRLADHAHAIRQMVAGRPKVRSIFTDHDSADQAEIKRELKRYKLHVRNARKGKGKDGLLPTIDEIRMLFWQGRLYINNERCPNTRRELLAYRWEESRVDEQLNEKPYPRDYMNHAMDALRYGVCSAMKASGVLTGPARLTRQPTIPGARLPSTVRNVLDDVTPPRHQFDDYNEREDD